MDDIRCGLCIFFVRWGFWFHIPVCILFNSFYRTISLMILDYVEFIFQIMIFGALKFVFTCKWMISNNGDAWLCMVSMCYSREVKGRPRWLQPTSTRLKHLQIFFFVCFCTTLTLASCNLVTFQFKTASHVDNPQVFSPCLKEKQGFFCILLGGRVWKIILDFWRYPYCRLKKCQMTNQHSNLNQYQCWKVTWPCGAFTCTHYGNKWHIRLIVLSWP